MRNLKRALSLALASVMLMGMMVVGSSAASFPDVDDEDNIEAIDVLETVQVMIGDEGTGEFRPDDPVNRAEMAVVMAKLLNLDYNYYVTSCPFTDVSGNYEWAKGWVGACAANGIVSGRGEGIFDPGATVTAVEAASMMMRALGYFQYPGDYQGGFETATVKQASQISLFSGIDGNANDPLNRNQVAKLALNALESNMVYFTGDVGFDFNGVNVGYRSEYTYRTGTEAKYATIDGLGDATQLNSSTLAQGQYYINLGEQLYDGKLELNRVADAFGRPSREWKYRGNEIGTYLREDLLRKEWTAEVTGKELYDEITKSILEDKTYAKTVYIDGLAYTADNVKINGNLIDLEKDYASLRNNKSGVLGTGNGVLTQLFINPKDKNHDVTVAVINTYLARAKADYNEKKDEVDFNVYGIVKATKDEYLKVGDTRGDNKDTKESMIVTGDDFTIEEIKKNDTFLVTVAEGEIQTIETPDVLDQSTMTAFKKDSYVVVDGTQYDYSDTAEWNYDVLDRYTADGRENLKDKSYDVYLDNYGYAIGIDLVDEVDNYIFITGVDDDLSNRFAKNVDASAIFLDGTMKTITYNTSDSDDLLANIKAGNDEYGLVNTWCTYSVNKDGIYTLKQVGSKIDTDSGKDVAQSWDKSLVGQTIDKKNIDMEGGSDEPANGFKKVYGNDNTVYLNASVKTINVNKPTSTWRGIIDDVDSVITGIGNVSLDVYTVVAAKTQADSNGKITLPANKCGDVAYGAYALYDDDGYIIAAVTVADDGSTSDNWVYVTSDSVTKESYDSNAEEWTWSREVVLDGELTEITYKGDALKHLNEMEKYNWYEVKYKGDGNVKSVKLAVDALSHNELDNGVTPAVTDSKYEGNINKLENTVQNGKDTILYEASSYQKTDGSTNHNHTGYGAFVDKAKQPYLNGKSFYVTTDSTTGFRVKDETKVVFLQTNKNKETIEYYEGPDKLENVVKSLNKGEDATATSGDYNYEISAVLDGNVARVVIVRDLNKDNGTTIDVGGGSDINTPGGESGVDVNVLAVLDFNGTADAPGTVSFVATGTDKITGAVKRDAVKKAYAKEYNVAESKIEVKYEDKKDGTMVYNVYVDGVLDESYVEAGVAKLVAVPTPKKLWDNLFADGMPDGEGEHNENTQQLSYAALYNGTYGNFVSWDAEFTPTIDTTDGSVTIDITGIKWITDLDSKVPGFYYDRDVAGSVNNYTIRQAYLISSADATAGSIDVPAGTSALRDTLSAANIESFAIIPMISAQTGQNIVNIYFKSADGKIYRQTGDQITGDGSTPWTSTSGHYGPSGTTTTIIPH